MSFCPSPMPFMFSPMMMPSPYPRRGRRRRAVIDDDVDDADDLEQEYEDRQRQMMTMMTMMNPYASMMMYPPQPGQCGMVQHPSMCQPQQMQPQTCHPAAPDDPFAPPNPHQPSHELWECDSLPANHCETSEICELKQQIEELRAQLNGTDAPSTSVCHTSTAANQCCDPESEPEPEPLRPVNLTCIYHGATEETPKEAYILRIPRDNNGYAYAYPKYTH